MSRFTNPPEALKSLSYYFKLAEDHESKYMPISYWCCIHALKLGLQINKKEENKETTAFLYKIIQWLEDVKKEQSTNQAITDDVEAANFVNSFITKYFTYAEKKESAGVCDKTIAKAYYNAATLIDIVSEFGTVGEELLEKQKFARYKAALIYKGTKPDQDTSSNKSQNTGINDDLINLNGSKSTPEPPPLPLPLPLPPHNRDDTIKQFEEPRAPPVTPIKPKDQTNYEFISALKKFDIPGSKPLEPYERKPELLKEAKKLCKHAESALNFEDIITATNNLERALAILKDKIFEEN